MPVTMFDTTDSPRTDGVRCPIPSTAQAVGGYTGGRWPSFDDLCHLYPHAHHLSIAVRAEDDADILDIEPGDARVNQAAAWVRRQQQRGVRKPGLYTSTSNLPALLAALKTGGVKREEVLIWEAHYDNIARISPGMDGKQYIDHGPRGENYDISIMSDAWFPPPAHYDWYPAQKVLTPLGRISERDTVVEWDHRMSTRHALSARDRVLRARLIYLRMRVWTVAHWGNPRHPSWAVAHRGFRWQGLARRAR